MNATPNALSRRRDRATGLSYLHRAGAGDFAPLVFLHGIGSDASSWSPVLQALDPAFDVLAWDAPGYRDSSPLATAVPTPTDYAEALTALLDQLDYRRVNLVGHSLGSLFAGRLAAAYPERVERLALLSPALGYRMRGGDPLPPAVRARLDNFGALGPQDFARKSAPRLLYRPESKPDLVAAIALTMSAVHPSHYVQAAHALAAGDLIGDAEAIVSPTLVAVGEEDIVTPKANAEALHGALRRPCPLIVVPQSGHALPQEAPRVVADFLTSFMKDRTNVRH